MADKIYEMQWDCEYCGTKKLLGKTHRFCPACGAVQNPEKRYFPAENEKVAVQDHIFVGADKHCPACQSAMSAAVKFCSQCGHDMEQGKTVRLVNEIAAATQAAVAAAPAKKKFHWSWVVFGSLLGLLILGVICVMAEEDISVTAKSHVWITEIRIEKFQTVAGSAWCDSMPMGAYNVSRSREQRSSRQIKTGESCSTYKEDQGDGTYAEKQRCSATYRSEPVYDDKCHFVQNLWKYDRSLTRTGGKNDKVSWEKVKLSRTGECLGCEREGNRNLKYTVHFTAGEEKFSCDFPEEARWKSFEEGKSYATKIGKYTRSLNCDFPAAD